nr:gliding motility-associated C-terminal domain-containing protein [Bacteroidota bacterium]
MPIITAGTDVLICNGASTTLTASGGITYVWSPSVGLNATTGNPVAANPTTQTTYTVTGTDANGCSNTDEVIIDINPQPEASFTGEYSVSCKGILGKFTNTSINALNYIWWLDDGITSTDINTEHLYNFGQAATITLIAINGICSDTISVPNDVLSLADYLKDIPNIFTPNGDGLNDCFALPKKFDFADCFTMSIYNRWGNKMFETSSTEKCWNGDNLQNAACPSGTYFYVIKIKEMQISKPLQLMR